MLRKTAAVLSISLGLLLWAPRATAQQLLIGFNNGAGYTVNGFGTFGPYTPTFSGPTGTRCS
jgi:hypothetical protein